jgi:hypothetical protein
MFNLLSGLASATIRTVTLPVAVVADLVTLGGSLNDKKDPYTADQLAKILADLDMGKK